MSAGHPTSLIHFLQLIHLDVSTIHLPCGFATAIHGDLNMITLSFVGTGFMRYMVRNMVGLLIEIGEGKRKSEDILTSLTAEDRNAAGITAHPEGLYLMEVRY